jgi:hypothetical protein
MEGCSRGPRAASCRALVESRSETTGITGKNYTRKEAQRLVEKQNMWRYLRFVPVKIYSERKKERKKETRKE